MAIANVALTDTFDQWRTKTNQLINVYDETNLLARSSYNATNLAVVTAANIAANIISGNSAVYTTIYNNANNTVNTIITISLNGFYDASNASFDKANAAIITSNNAYDQANNARDVSNIAVANVIAYSDSINTTVSLFTAGQTANYANFTATTNGTITLYFDSMNVESNITRTIANLAYDTANNFVANSANVVSQILASNTIIQDTINATAIIVIADILGNTDFGGAYDTANLSFDKANSANILAFNTGIGANAFTSATISGANTAVGAGANAYANLVWSRSNSFTSATIAGANTAVGGGANAFTSSTIAGANTAVGAGANAYANLVWSRSNTFTSSTIAGANTAVGAGANAFTSATIAGANTAVGTGANTFASAVGVAANTFTSATIAGANTAVGTGANAFTSATVSGANTIAIAAFNRANSTTYASNVVISVADNTNAALRITQTGTGNALVVEDAANPDSTPFIVDANGNVLVGTVTNPNSSRLHLSAGGNSRMLQLTGTDVDSSAGIGLTNDVVQWNFAVRGDASDAVILRNITGSVDAVTVTTDGNVGIGRSNPGVKLDVVGTVNASAILVNGSPLTAGGGGTTITIQEDTLDAVRYIAFVNNTTGNASTLNVSTSGLTFNPATGTLSATVFNSTSDINKKTDITEIDNAIDKVLSMRGVGFKWKDNGLQSYGLIAQEVEKILPDLVDATNDTKSINYSGLIAFLIEAIKELNDKIENK